MRLADVDKTAEEVADLARLTYVDRRAPGWTRRRCGRGFSYRDSRGTTLPAAARDRIEGLAIPPAWTDVWICPSAEGHLQAVGMDDAGRWQYLYHEAFRAEAERIKYLRLGPFGASLERIRRAVAADLCCGNGSVERMTAAVVRVIDAGLMRVGSDAPDEPDEAAGATTMPADCVTVDDGAGTVAFEYTGKGGKGQRCRLDDHLLARAVADGLEAGGDRAFVYRDDDGFRPVTAEQVNRYLQDVTGQGFTAKDFRTWGGSVIVAEHLASNDPPASERHAEEALRDGVDLAAERLGNTRAVARASYLSPTIADAYLTGELADTWARTRSGKWASRSERVVTRVHEDRM